MRIVETLTNIEISIGSLLIDLVIRRRTAEVLQNDGPWDGPRERDGSTDSPAFWGFKLVRRRS